MLSTADPEELGVAMALERASSLHERVRATLAASNDYYALPASPITDTEQKALRLLLGKLGALEARLQDYRLVQPAHTEARTRLLHQVDIGRRELLMACRQCVHHSDNCHELVAEVLAFCEVANEQPHATPQFYDLHAPLHSDGHAGQQQINFRPVPRRSVKALEQSFAAVSVAPDAQPKRDTIAVPRSRAPPQLPAVVQDTGLDFSCSDSGSEGCEPCQMGSPAMHSPGEHTPLRHPSRQARSQ